MLERPLERELHYARSVQRVDDLELAKTWGGHEIALLVLGRSVAAGAAERAVLDVTHATAVLDVVVGVIHHVEYLRLQRDGMALGYFECARQSEIDLLGPGTVERVQTGEGTRAAGVDAKSGVGGGLEDSGVVD